MQANDLQGMRYSELVKKSSVLVQEMCLVQKCVQARFLMKKGELHG